MSVVDLADSDELMKTADDAFAALGHAYDQALAEAQKAMNEFDAICEEEEEEGTEAAQDAEKDKEEDAAQKKAADEEAADNKAANEAEYEEDDSTARLQAFFQDLTGFEAILERAATAEELRFPHPALPLCNFGLR